MAVPALRPRRPPHLSPYQGKLYSAAEIDEAIAELEPWIEVVKLSAEHETPADDAAGSGAAGWEEAVVQETVDALLQGEVVAWFQGQSEVGAARTAAPPRRRTISCPTLSLSPRPRHLKPCAVRLLPLPLHPLPLPSAAPLLPLEIERFP